MTVLQNFYFGNIQPCEYKQSPEIRRKLSDMTITSEKLKGNISDDHQRTEIDKVFEKQTELIALCERDAFLAGFRLGIKMMCEIYN